jgi:hypothetical protein
MPVKHRHAIADLFDLLGRRWALRVLWELRDEPVPYGACASVATRSRHRCSQRDCASSSRPA